MEPATEDFIDVQGSDFFISNHLRAYVEVEEKYGKTHEIEAIYGTSVELSELADNQSVCSAGNEKGYYFRLTKKQNNVSARPEKRT